MHVSLSVFLVLLSVIAFEFGVIGSSEKLKLS